MAKVTTKKYSKKKIKLFLFFLLLASIFWVLTKFSREFTASMVAKINYLNMPETAALAQNNINELTYDLTANGFEILFYKFKKPSLDIDVSSYYPNNEDGFTVPRNKLVQNLSSNFNRYMEIKNLSVDGLKVNLDPIVLKKVRVRAQVDISFKEGFKPIDSVQIKPDSIMLSGPKGILEQINSVSTEVLSLKNVEKSISETVKIKSPSNEIVQIKPSGVTVKWPVAEFSQGKFILPVEVINLPPGLELKLVPERISVSFDIAVNDFTAVNAQNFRVICDYAQRNEKENFMLPTLAKMPAGAVNIVFEPKKVDFFIFK